MTAEYFQQGHGLLSSTYSNLVLLVIISILISLGFSHMELLDIIYFEFNYFLCIHSFRKYDMYDLKYATRLYPELRIYSVTLGIRVLARLWSLSRIFVYNYCYIFIYEYISVTFVPNPILFLNLISFI